MQTRCSQPKRGDGASFLALGEQEVQNSTATPFPQVPLYEERKTSWSSEFILTRRLCATDSSLADDVDTHPRQSVPPIDGAEGGTTQLSRWFRSRDPSNLILFLDCSRCFHLLQRCAKSDHSSATSSAMLW